MIEREKQNNRRMEKSESNQELLLYVTQYFSKLRIQVLLDFTSV